MTPEEIARKYSSRQGFRLATYREVGLPLWEINLRCLTLAHRELPPLQEFALKAIGAELVTIDRIRRFLGIRENNIVAVVADLLTNDYISLNSDETDETKLELTTNGRRRLADMEELKPEERVYPLFYDGLIRRFVRLGNVPLYTAFELKGEGIEEIPAFPNDPPQVNAISVTEVAVLLNEVASSTEVRRDLLSILGIEGNRRRHFQRSVALVYESSGGAEPVVEFAIDGRLSDEHARAFAAAEGVRKLGFVKSLRRTASDVAINLIPKEVLDQAPPPEDLQLLRQTAETLRDAVEDLHRKMETTDEGPEHEAVKQQLIEASRKLGESDASIAQLPVRALEVFEVSAQ